MSDVSDVNVNLAENEHIKELLELLKANGMGADAQGVKEVIEQVMSVQTEINKAIGEVTAMRGELTAMREEQKHPVKTMLHKAADGLLAKLKEIRQSLISLKDKIIDVCKRAVEAFKDQGITALNSAVTFLDIKQDLEGMRNRINNVIDYNHGQIAKIEAASAEMHSAGRAIKNIGRAMRGKEPIPEIKPNGRLAGLIETPFQNQIRRLNRSKGRTNNILSHINRLEKAAALRAERGRPSALTEIREREANKPERECKSLENVRTAEAEH